MARFFRPEFDREADFYVLRPFTWFGENLTPGRLLDNAEFTDRRLRQLFDRRDIGYKQELDGGIPVVNGHPPRPPAPTVSVVRPLTSAHAGLGDKIPPKAKKIIERYSQKSDKAPVARKRLKVSA